MLDKNQWTIIWLPQNNKSKKPLDDNLTFCWVLIGEHTAVLKSCTLSHLYAITLQCSILGNEHNWPRKSDKACEWAPKCIEL